MTPTFTVIATIAPDDGQTIEAVREALEKTKIGQGIKVEEIYVNDPPVLADQTNVGKVRISNRRMFDGPGR